MCVLMCVCVFVSHSLFPFFSLYLLNLVILHHPAALMKQQ